MSLTTALAAVAALAAGTVGALTAYELAAPEPTAAPAAETVEQRPRADRPRFAPCRKPARLEDGKCVTTRTRQVVLPGQEIAAAAPAPVPAPPAPAPAPVGGDDQPLAAGDARRDVGEDLDVVEDDDFDDPDDPDTGDTGTHTGTQTGGGTHTGTQTRSGDTGTSG